MKGGRKLQSTAQKHQFAGPSAPQSTESGRTGPLALTWQDRSEKWVSSWKGGSATVTKVMPLASPAGEKTTLSQIRVNLPGVSM